jgi:lysozyme family protein
MADIKAAVDFVLKQEDATMVGEVTGYKDDRGGRTRFGIAERWHPDLTKTGFYDDMDRDHALVIAENVLVEQYADPILLAQIDSQAIATALLSMAVVEGNREAVKLLQMSVGANPDGGMGPQTLAKVNSFPDVMTQYGMFQRAYFQRLAANDPTQLRFVHGWLNRMNAVQALA